MSKEIITFNPEKVKDIVYKKTRGKRGVTQKSIANEIGISVARLFSGNPTAKRMAQIATSLKVDVNSFFDIPDTFFENKYADVVSDDIPEYEIKKEDLYKKLYEQQSLITKLTRENNKYRILLIKNNIALNKIDGEN